MIALSHAGAGKKLVLSGLIRLRIKHKKERKKGEREKGQRKKGRGEGGG